MNKTFKGAIILTLCMAVLTACSENKSQSAEHGASHKTSNGDLQEKTASFSTLPTFLANQRTEIKSIYQLAAQNQDLLKWIPCYCGCGEEAGHKSNLNCFIKESQENGSLIWDDHGTRCNVCLEISVVSAQAKIQGKTTLEIRKMIDERYGKGYGKPTLTPMPV